jgi:hypothetical protein
MQVLFNVEDPKTFNMPWNGMVRYQRNARQEKLDEEVCAENNFDVVTKKPYPIPIADRPDF